MKALTPATATAVLVCAVAAADAALIAHFEMNSPLPLKDTQTVHSFTDPGGASSPTHLPTGGINGSGAYQFSSASSEYLSYNHVFGPYLFLGANNSDWTFSFWIKTNDAGSFGGYAGTPQLPVLGNTTGGVGFGIGIDGGKATYKRYSTMWNTAQGTVNVADGLGHYVTFVAHNSATLDIFIDGSPDVQGLAIPPTGFGQLGIDLGRSYFNGVTHHYGDFIIDDIRLWDTDLDRRSIKAALGLPEPASALLMLGAGAMLVARRQR